VIYDSIKKPHKLIPLRSRRNKKIIKSKINRHFPEDEISEITDVPSREIETLKLDRIRLNSGNSYIHKPYLNLD
jgi:hypothetical protein